MAKRQKVEELVSDHFHGKMPKRVKKALGAALANLYHGPVAGEMGYSKATKILEDWWSDNGSEVWVDTQADFVSEDRPVFVDEVSEDDPDYEYAQWPEDWMELSRRDAARVVFGALVTDGGLRV